MKKSLVFLALAMLIVIGIISSIWIAHRRALARWQPRTITEITQESTPGFGHFPAYKVILRPHQSTYIGNVYDHMHGTWRSDDVDFGSCEQNLRRSGFFALEDHYQSLASDQTTVTTSGAYPTGRKTVVSYGSVAPRKFEYLEMQIENAVAKAHWHKVSGTDTW